MDPRRPILRDLALLTALCGLVYFTGLTTHGLTNWQEAQRAQVAREMQARGDWVVPWVDGRPYLNKPPMIYWGQLALAWVRGAPTSEWDLRFVVALGGWAGVISTYLVTRRVLRPIGNDDPDRARRAEDSAWWASLFLATGILYTRSARIGELDILLVPFTVLAIGLIAEAWRTHLERARTNWPALAGAAAAGCGAMLTKGPPGLLVIGLAGYGGMLLWAAWQATEGARVGSDPVRVAWARGDAPALAGAGAGAVALSAASVWMEPGSVWTLDGVTGMIAFAAIGGMLGATVVRLARGPRVRGFLGSMARTHPVAVLGLPVGALWLWGWAVARRLGTTSHLEGTVRGEAADNLRPLVLESPLNNLEAASYGAGLGSLGALIAVIWLIRRRPVLPAGWWIVAGWVVLGLVAFSTIGKGVPRYLTPLWPGIAVAGGAWLAWKLAHVERARVLRGVAAAGVLALAGGQAWWYADGRERLQGHRCPRAFLAEVLAHPGVDAARLATFEFDTPQVDYYVGRRVTSYIDADPKPKLDGVGPATFLDLKRRMEREGGPFTLLLRRTQPRDFDPAPARDRLEAAGFVLEALPVSARYTIDNGRTEIAAVRISAR